jgi:hypothetical protein
MFKKYMHIERFGNNEVQGIEFGNCVIMPKIDGTNGSIWLEDDGIHAGGRHRELSIEQDNAGFYVFVQQNENIKDFFKHFPDLRLYGEWLVPHSLKIYRDDAWRHFYVFDVYDDEKEKFIPYDAYQVILEKFKIDYIPAMSTFKNATYDNLLIELENNKFLIREGEGFGEGIVIKNYDFKNRFGHTVWAKVVSNMFKEKHLKTMGATEKNFKEMIEQKIVDEYVDAHFVNKVYANIVNECEGWNSKYIPRLLNTVYYDLINEELWNFVKKMKNPTINFRTLLNLTIFKIKSLKPELF